MNWVIWIDGSVVVFFWVKVGVVYVVSMVVVKWMWWFMVIFLVVCW